MKRKTREERAITLIALIITIVVLLILAVVAINAVTGDGIIQHATNAKKEYEEAQEEEQDVLTYYEQYLEAGGNAGVWIQDKTVIKNIETEQIIEIGDYVNYVSGVSGYTDTQGWRVLGSENGRILLISSDNIAEEVLSGSKDFINNVGINRLNKICENYGNGTGAKTARIVAVEDINRVTGYDPLNAMYYYEGRGKVTQYLNEVTYTLTEDGKVYFSSDIHSGNSTNTKFIDLDGSILVKESEYEELEGTSKEITLQSNFYGYYGSTLTNKETDEIKGLKTDSEAYKLLFTKENGTYREYWLGSSYIWTNNGYVNWGIRTVESGAVLGCDVYQSVKGTITSTCGVRVVVVLESNVKLEENGANNWNMSI